jgi:hypothetical protein
VTYRDPNVDGPTEVSLDWMGVKSVDEPLALPNAELARRVSRAPFPASEKLIGAVVVIVLDRLMTATDALSESSKAMDDKTESLVKIANNTLRVAVLSLVVAIVALVIALVK